MTSEEMDKALIKTFKATDSYIKQEVICMYVRAGKPLHFKDVEEDQEKKLHVKFLNAKYAIMNLQSIVRILPRYYNLHDDADVREMIFDVAEIIDSKIKNKKLVQ